MIREAWKPVPGFEGLYLVSDRGRIARQLSTGYRLLKIQRDEKGYEKVALSRAGRSHTLRVHRLVAQAFLPNPLGLPEVNHQNEVRHDNRVCNLEWCDRAYNVNYGTRTEKQRAKLSKAVQQLTLSGQFLASFDSMTLAAALTGISSSNIAACCKGIRKRAGQFRWAYAGGAVHE